MKYASATGLLADLGAEKWAVHQEAMRMKAAGQDVVIASIGEPEIAPARDLLDSCVNALLGGRTGYSNGQGESHLLAAIAEKYSGSSGRRIGPENVMCLPGTQTALYTVMAGILDKGDAVLVGDPYYATYEGVVAAQAGEFVPVPLHPDNGFRMQAADLAAAITPDCRALLLNTPHNPTGAILTRDELERIGALCREHDLWIISDEVYADMVFEGGFISPLALPELAERTVVVSSISKSHAAPGLRSGWIVAPAEFIRTVLPLSEVMLFGNQPFIADATAHALTHDNPVGEQLCRTYGKRARMLFDHFQDESNLRPLMPDAGMFLMLDISATGLDGEAFAWKLLRDHGVSVMPGEAFGKQSAGFIRIGLTVTDNEADRIAECVTNLARGA